MTKVANGRTTIRPYLKIHTKNQSCVSPTIFHVLLQSFSIQFQSSWLRLSTTNYVKRYLGNIQVKLIYTTN
ncbi:hypothetical protein AQUCO_00201205v1 [Aquilegia coerulea]|uniref:Uncharacterized protein n=1 Tax=Aquilegia coerulea TaxID=218851 RepID=A0A2G5F6V5_AQUCA|nr:hypothetical protein AQUCO_00201205v1 [Aquilegia coerulea]